MRDDVQQSQSYRSEEENDANNDCSSSEYLQFTCFSKIAPPVHQVRKASLSICALSGFSLSLDEMMVRFCGYSSQTRRMKKAITEGYKGFVLANAKMGTVIYFLPDGRIATQSTVGPSSGANEYQ